MESNKIAQLRSKLLTTIRNLTVMVEHTGKRISVEEMDSTMTAEEFLDALANKINLPVGTQGRLVRKLTCKQFLPTQSMTEVGIKDGETLINDESRTASQSGEQILRFEGKNLASKQSTEKALHAICKSGWKTLSCAHNILLGLAQPSIYLMLPLF